MAATPDVIAIRSGSHPGFGRIVIDVGADKTFKLDQVGDHVTVRFSEPINLDQAPSPPRNVVTFDTHGATADFVVAPGTSVHPKVISDHLVFDILDAASAASPPQAAPPASSLPAVAVVPVVVAQDKRPKPARAAFAGLTMARSPEVGGRALAPVAAAPSQAASASGAPETVPDGVAPAAIARLAVPPPTLGASGQSVKPSKDTSLETMQPTSPGRDVMPESVGPVGLLAQRTKLPKGLKGAAFMVPFGETTGAAMFQRSGGTFIVFDERRPIDMSALHLDQMFAEASVQLLPTGTLFRLPLPAGISIALSQTPQGWRIAGLTALPKIQPIVATVVDGGVLLAAELPNNVISLADPDSGATLLVGTQRRSGQGVTTIRQTADFMLRATALGVIVEPLSDAIAMKVVSDGFRLTSGGGGIAASPRTSATDVLMQAAYLTRRLEFSSMPAEALMRIMTRQMADAALAPAQAKGPKRRAVAQTMIALGLAAEAESLLMVAAAQDPRQAASADVTALTAIAALLAGRVADADGINDPRLTGSDDMALWRAVRQAMLDEGSPSAAAVFAGGAPLALLYPKPIGDQILPLMVETMIQGGEIAPAARVLAQRPKDVTLDYARALQKQAEGDTDQALAMLDSLAAGHDRFDRARASVRAVELRASTGKIDPSQAANALDKLIYTWRGDRRELALRERVAELHGQAGNWRVALATLRQAETDFPEQAAAVHDRLKEGFASMVAGHGLEKMTPIDVVAAIDENADLMPVNGSDPVLEEQLSDRLLALDLPERAKPVLQKLLRSTTSPPGKARFGVTLASLQAREKDDAGALASLDASAAPDLPPDLVEKRALVRAGAMARRGDPAGAVATLATFGTPASKEARAMILEQAEDWPAAQQAWADFATTALPAAGDLDAAQSRTLLRLATAAARAGDENALGALRTKYDSRIGPGALADMFRLLTAQPVRGTGDLKRANQEVSLAQSLPANLKALGGAAPVR